MTSRRRIVAHWAMLVGLSGILTGCSAGKSDPARNAKPAAAIAEPAPAATVDTARVLAAAEKAEKDRADAQARADADAKIKADANAATAARRKADDDAAAKKRADEDAVARKRADDAVAARKADDAAARLKADADAAARKKADEDAAARKRADDAAAKLKSDTDAARKRADGAAAATAPAAAAAPAVTGLTAVVTDMDAVNDTLQQFAEAYRNADAKRIAALYPSFPLADFAAHSAQVRMQTYSVAASPRGIRFTNAARTSASVTTTVKFSRVAVNKRDSVEPQSAERTFFLDKRNGSWIITDIK